MKICGIKGITYVGMFLFLVVIVIVVCIFLNGDSTVPNNVDTNFEVSQKKLVKRRGFKKEQYSQRKPQLMKKDIASEKNENEDKEAAVSVFELSGSLDVGEIKMSLDDIVEFVTKYGDAQGGVEQIDAILDVFDQVSLSEFLTLVHAAVENPDELYQSTGLKALKIMIGALTKNNERVSSEKGSKVNFTDRDKSDIWNILSKSIASSSATIRESGVVTGLSMPDEIRTTFLSAGITSENEDVRKRLLPEFASWID